MLNERDAIISLILTCWVVQLTHICHGFVAPRLYTQQSAAVGRRFTHLRPLKQKQPSDENDDEHYTPYYDGDYRLVGDTLKSSNVSRRRVRPNFEAVFQGMPGLADILYGGKKDTPKIPLSDQNKQKLNDNRDLNEIEEGQLSIQDLEEIESNFQRFKAEMRDSLQKMRQKDPDSVPENAEFILDQVVQEQRAYDIKEKSQLRAIQDFDSYYKDKFKRTSVDKVQPERVEDDPVVQEIVEEINLNKKAQADLDEKYRAFKDYENKSRDNMKKESDIYSPDAKKADFDQLQLELMRDLLIKRQEAAMKKGILDDEDLYTTNNLEDGIDELSSLIEEKQRLGDDALGGSKWTLKDWQMYRAIASKVSDKKKGLDVDDLGDNDDDDEDDGEDDLDHDRITEDDDLSISDKRVIAKKLDAWKEYQLKEASMRKKMGLSVDIRSPFPWSDKLYEGGDKVLYSDADKKSPPRKIFSPEEVENASLFLDQTAVQVMTDLMMKTQDKERREKLRLEIEELKVEIQRREKATITVTDPTTDVDQKSTAQPFSISDLFGGSQRSNSVSIKQAPKTDPVIENQALKSIPKSPISPPPSLSPPVEADLSLEIEAEDDIIPSLGTLKEQKFRSLVARSGVRTVEEQEALRAKWEDFQRAEQRMRDQTGLSGKDTSSSTLNYQEKLKYNVSEVLLKGGDVNADAILSTIGQRPRRKNRDSSVSTSQLIDETDLFKPKSKDDSYQSFLEYEERLKAQRFRQENETNISYDSTSKDDEKLPTKQDGDENDIPEQIYRSYGPTALKDPSQNLQDKNAFEEYLQREEEARKSFQDASTMTPVRSDINIDTYADDVLSNLKPRPKLIKSNENSSPQDLDDILPRKPRNQEDSDAIQSSTIRNMIKKSSSSRTSSILSEQMPDWLRREIEEKRGEEFELSDKEKSQTDDEFRRLYDDLDEDEYEERERQAADFEQKFSKAPKEVSISDLFDRDYFGPDDVDDYYDGRSSQEYFSSFDSRKATLMEYRVLSIEDLNSLMEFKNSAIETGVSPYLAKVNKPFSSFGAIFRLEGSLFDISGLQYSAWKKTAEEHGLQVPDTDDVRFAAVHSPEFSIQRIFYWTNDIVFVRAVAKTYRSHFSTGYETWIKGIGLKTDDEVPRKARTNPTAASNDSSESPTKSPMKLSESDILKLQLTVWSKVADKFGFRAPTFENIQFTLGFTPEEAVKGVFMWTRDSNTVAEVTTLYKNILRDETNGLLGKSNIQQSIELEVSSTNASAKITQNHKTEPKNIITEEDVMALHLQSWTYAAEQHGYRKPSIDEVQAAKFIGPEKAVQSIFKWSTSPSTLMDVVSTFRTQLKTLSLHLTAKMNAVPSNIGNSNDKSEPKDDLEPYVVKAGIFEFLSALDKVKTPCAIISHLESRQMDLLLQVSGLDRFFRRDMRVSESDAYESESQQLLGAALRIERRPDHCALFTSTPQSCVSAHEMQMKSVALVGPYPRYDLTTADSTLLHLDAINTMNLRALFSDEKTSEPMEQLQIEGPQVKKKPMVKTRFWEDGDR